MSVAYGLNIYNAQGKLQVDGIFAGYGLYDTFRLYIPAEAYAIYGDTFPIHRFDTSEIQSTDIVVARVMSPNVRCQLSLTEHILRQTGSSIVADSWAAISAIADDAIEILVAVYRRLPEMVTGIDPGDWGLAAYNEDGELIFDNRQYGIVVNNVQAGNFGTLGQVTMTAPGNSGIVINGLRPFDPASEGIGGMRFIEIEKISNGFTISAVDRDGYASTFKGDYYSFVAAELPPGQVYEFYSGTNFSAYEDHDYKGTGYFAVGFDPDENLGLQGFGNNPPNAQWACAIFISTQDKVSNTRIHGGYRFGITGIHAESVLKYIAVDAKLGPDGVFVVGQDTVNGGTYRYYTENGNTYWTWGLSATGVPEDTEEEAPGPALFGNRWPLRVNARWNTETIG